MKAAYKSIHPIGNSDPNAMPVPQIAKAIPYYEKIGFAVSSRNPSPVPTAVVSRDSIRITLAENGGDPEQASCYIEVSDVEAARQELIEADAAPTEVRTDQHGGSNYKVFFIRDDVGLCYCLGQKQ